MTIFCGDATHPASARQPTSLNPHARAKATTTVNPAASLTVELGPPNPLSGRRTANLTIEADNDSGSCEAEPALDEPRSPNIGTRAKPRTGLPSTHRLAPEDLCTFISVNSVTELRIASLETAPLDETLDLLHKDTPLLRIDLETMSFDLTDTLDRRLAELVLVMTVQKLKELAN